MFVKFLGVFIIAGIYSALSLFVENLIRKLFHVKERKMDKKCEQFLCVRYKDCAFSHHCSAIMCLFRYDKACDNCIYRISCGMQRKRTDSLNRTFANSTADYSQEVTV